MSDPVTDQTDPQPTDRLAGAERGAMPMQDGPALVAELPVTVVLRITPLPEHRWLDQRVETMAVLPARPDDQPDLPDPAIAETTDGTHVIRHDGLVLKLFPDECESYYFNLMVDEPQCFVVFKNDPADVMVPLEVTASYDLAASYEEGDHRVDSVALDGGLYPQIEAFVLAHYVAEKKVKRKRRDWRKE